MAHVSVIDNETQPVGAVLVHGIRSAADVKIATAFAKKTGLDEIVDSLEFALARGSSACLVYGLDFCITDDAALTEFAALAEEYPSFSHYVYSDWRLTFHPKLYIWKSTGGQVTAVVGSSNLTAAGLWRNLEVNAVISGGAGETPIAEGRPSSTGSGTTEVYSSQIPTMWRNIDGYAHGLVGRVRRDRRGDCETTTSS